MSTRIEETAAQQDTATATATATEEAATEDLAGRLFGEGVGTAHLLTVYLGVRLGLFRPLTEGAGLTAAELADTAGLDARYVLEWLQAETIAGLVVASGDDLRSARFSAAPGVRGALVDETSAAYVGGLTYVGPAVGRVLPELLAAFRSGAGVPYAAYGPEAVEAQGSLNRPAYIHELAQNWLPAIPDVAGRLSDTARTVRIADVGCGVGWAAIELAKAFPHVIVDGVDVDEESIRRARHNAVEHGVADRVTFEVLDVTTEGLAHDYDLVLFLECVHDLPRPARALAAARSAVADGGAVIVMDERVGDTLPEAGDPIETFFATASVLWCLPQSRVDPECEAPGTVMRPATFGAIARAAGWAGYEDLAIEHPFFRFYRLTR